MDAFKRTASPFTISRDIRFWVGQEGCGYSLSTGGMKGNGNQHPVVVPHPQWGLYQAAGLLGRPHLDIAEAGFLPKSVLFIFKQLIPLGRTDRDKG